MNDNQTHELERLKKIFIANFGNPFKLLAPFLFFLLALGAYSSFYTVEPDEEAVIIRLGRYLKTTSPGLHFKIPFGIDQSLLVKTTKVHQAEFGFRTSQVGTDGHSRYSSGNYGSESLMLTGDLNVADVEWVVQYKISDPYKYLFKASNPIQNIRDVSESIMRRVVGDMSVNDVLTTGRAEISSQAKILVQEVLDKYDIGISVTVVLLQDVNPPEAVKPSFNEVNEAKQEQAKWINQAEEAYNKVIPEARGKAEEVVSQAEGFGSAMINRAQGDAHKFSALLKEYKLAPAITRKRMYIDTMEQIYKNFSELTIVDSDIKGVLPVFSKLSEKEIK